MDQERILDVFPAQDDLHRLVLAAAKANTGQPRYSLRQETFSSDVGWFVQSRVSLEAGQIEGLKAALTCGRGQRQPKMAPNPASHASNNCAVVPFRIASAG